ncbi:hypothetical protein EJ08DRAFT_652163 [Tothia fuscella]|uniref:ATP synthase protein 8 n=1 Tax=Tothia fuscella TaxID=1048955 RepID=A0A9P4NKL8_9PEZI|nr:hypothetical protein EJ08DRAFT_652163 [Tothia fuscella]
MSTPRILRPFARAVQRPIIRPTNFAAFSTKSTKAIAPFTPSINAPLRAKTSPNASPKTQSVLDQSPMTKLTVLKSAMPQLIPFYFVNETVVAFVLLPTLIYVFSKYLLPQRVRVMCARLFISKL